MINLTQEIERIENMPVEDVTETIHNHLLRLREQRDIQSSKGGPDKERRQSHAGRKL